MIREYDRASRCRRVEDVKRGRKFHRLNVIGGLFCGLVVALFCYEHSTCGVFFEDWFENTFLPCVPRGVTIILDNASFHRKKKLSAIVERAGVSLLFLPAYSPDFNRIENRWANMKRALPDLMPKCETLEGAVYNHFNYSNS
ncbi:MAG: transposase [Candidatus Bathyarchaeota archaeon]|nr:transposase [Candidatus Termiticorpusculum sp.]